MPIPKFKDATGMSYELVMSCSCGYAVEKCRTTRKITECPLCGKTLTMRRIDHPDKEFEPRKATR